MKIKGAKSIRCDLCGRIIGWTIPTGIYDHGIKRVEIRLNKDGNEFFNGFAQHFRCDNCMNNHK